MSRQRLLAVFALFFLIAMVLLLPLRLIIGTMIAGTPGIALRDASGNAWRGQLRGLSWGHTVIDTVSVALKPLPLFIGERHWQVETDTLTAILIQGRSRGVREAGGQIRIDDPRLPAPLTLGLQDARIVFRDGSCGEAGGSISLEWMMPGDAAGELAPATPVRLEGQLQCSGASVVAGLQSADALPPGVDRIDARVEVEVDGRVTIDTVADTDASAGRLGLQLAGFETSADGMRRQDTFVVLP